MLVAVKFLSDDVMKDTTNYKNFLKQQKRNIYGREYFYQTDDDLHVNDIVLVPVDYKYQTGALKAAVVTEVIIDGNEIDSPSYEIKWVYSKITPTKYLNRKIDNMRKADLLVKLNKRQHLIAKINELRHAAVDDKEIVDILAKLNLTDTDLDDLIDILPDSDFKF